jgi:hypothetical protein
MKSGDSEQENDVDRMAEKTHPPALCAAPSLFGFAGKRGLNGGYYAKIKFNKFSNPSFHRR